MSASGPVCVCTLCLFHFLLLGLVFAQPLPASRPTRGSSRVWLRFVVDVASLRPHCFVESSRRKKYECSYVCLSLCTSKGMHSGVPFVNGWLVLTARSFSMQCASRSAAGGLKTRSAGGQALRMRRSTRRVESAGCWFGGQFCGAISNVPC